MKCPECGKEDIELRVDKYEVILEDGTIEIRQEWTCRDCFTRFVTKE